MLQQLQLLKMGEKYSKTDKVFCIYSNTIIAGITSPQIHKSTSKHPDFHLISGSLLLHWLYLGNVFNIFINCEILLLNKNNLQIVLIVN